MRLIIEFTVEKNEFPIEYRRFFMHFLKTCINDANEGKYFDKYYKKAQAKNFTFSIFFDGPIFNNNNIELSSNKVKMIFSTSEQLTGLIFYSSFLEKKSKKIKISHDNSMVIKNVTKIADPTINNNKILIKMNSPLLIRSHCEITNKDYYFSYLSDSFINEAERVIRFQLTREGFQSEFLEGFKIVPIKCRKVIIKHYDCMLEASLRNFMIVGNPAILKYLVMNGIGSRKSEGFGMAELLTDEV
ncbi:MAG: CRISPR-associated endoribonuclease Cas6 [Clostridiales bacterium]|nr:CRISPR-associated endoribonuclease Cas6 [Clostridiales bacterium]